ncbi:hypothetical protein [Patulibacter minatonensis]|uniref:hypothetical protein n=1 Tax=Patulibacter minatonensis TaxID=298163 RepID=UPI0006868756|nr:hypothetical protein [Patulibacter minatonensis]
MAPLLTRLPAPRGLHPVIALAGWFVAALLAFRLWVEDPGVEYGGGPAGWIARVAHTVNLLFHEAGHVLLAPLGWDALTLLGGTLLQLLVPIVLVGLAVRERRPGALVVVLMLLSTSAYSAATYVADARARELPLITGDSSHHDWGQLIYEIWDVPGAEEPIALVLRVLGIAAFVAATAVCVLAGRRWAAGRDGAPAIRRRPLGPYGR